MTEGHHLIKISVNLIRSGLGILRISKGNKSVEFNHGGKGPSRSVLGSIGLLGILVLVDIVTERVEVIQFSLLQFGKYEQRWILSKH
jgi:hypothetical protein